MRMADHFADSRAAHGVVGIANGHVALELELTGILVEHVADAAEAEEALAALLESDTRIVVVQENLEKVFSEGFVDRLARHRGNPLVVYCPLFDEEDAEVDEYVAALLKPAVTARSTPSRDSLRTAMTASDSEDPNVRARLLTSGSTASKELAMKLTRIGVTRTACPSITAVGV